MEKLQETKHNDRGGQWVVEDEQQVREEAG